MSKSNREHVLGLLHFTSYTTNKKDPYIFYQKTIIHLSSYRTTNKTCISFISDDEVLVMEFVRKSEEHVS